MTYRGLCRRCTHAFNGGPGTPWTDDRPHYCAGWPMTKASAINGQVITCTDFDQKRLGRRSDEDEDHDD